MRTITLAIIAVLLCVAGARAQRIIYVDDDAAGLETGVSWTDGYRDLQDALDDARDVGGCPCEVWVAAGVYKPDRGTGDRVLSFDLFNNLGVYGGFVGTETRRSQRNPSLHETILDGDLNDNDDFIFEPTSSCCFNNPKVGCDDQACRGVVVERWSNCDRLWDFFCAEFARELCCDLCVPSFCENSICVVRSIDTDETPVLDGLTITGAHARGSEEESALGVGALHANLSSLTVNGCVVRDNEAGGMSLVRGAPTVTNTTFLRNRTFFALSTNLNEPEISGCAFIENTGVGMLTSGQVVVRDSLFVSNSAGGLMLHDAASVVGCTFIGNRAFSGAGVSGSGVHVIADCMFIGNHAKSNGGGLSIHSGVVVNSLFVGNMTGEPGTPFTGNSAAISGGLGFLELINATIVRNTTGGSTGGVFSSGGMRITNTIIWGNEAGWDGTRTERAQVRAATGVSLEINYSLVEGWTGDLGGVGNGGTDPMFVDKDGLDDISGTEDDNVRLLPGSPAINAGDPVGFVGPAADLDGHPRTMCDRRDIGAYEFGIGDYDCNQTVDLIDFSAWDSCVTGPGWDGEPYPDDCKPFDFNTDSVIDLLDLAGFQRVIEKP